MFEDLEIGIRNCSGVCYTVRDRRTNGLPELAKLLATGHAACAGCGLAIAMKLVLQAMGPRTIAVIVPSCEGAIGGVYPNTAYGVSTFHSAFEIAAPTAAGIANGLKIQGKNDIQVRGLCRRRRNV